MPAPIDYTTGFVNPMQSLQQTLQLGGQLAQLGRFRDQRIAAQENAEAERIAAEQKAARDAEIRTLRDAARANPTAENFQALASLYPPEQQDAIRKGFTMLDDASKKSMVNGAMDVFIAFDSGQPEIAISRMEDKVAAYKNAGNEKAATDLQVLVDLAKTGDKGQRAVADMFGANIALMDKEAMEGYAKYRESKREDSELLRINADLEAAKKTGGLDPEKRFQSELSLNKEYETRTRGYTQALELDSIIKTSAADSTGAGDLALVTSFMKMLDKGSVVRETEFAKAQDTSGLLDKLKTSAQKVASGQFLTPEQRKDFVRLAEQYMTASSVNEKKVRDSLGFMVKNYGLNPDNVFGTMADKKETETETPQASSELANMKTFLKTKWPGEAAKIDSLDLAGLQREYKNTLAGYKPAAVATPAAQEPVRTGTW